MDLSAGNQGRGRSCGNEGFAGFLLLAIPPAGEHAAVTQAAI
ncbi:MAG: hypothetical protein O2820_09850 [Planctomycetota bacterium]|nr:hypothetical protein [Planctomycetota bacterium]MDA1249516.1 hypothetical protein [Planctomycetota bacterium]